MPQSAEDILEYLARVVRTYGAWAILTEMAVIGLVLVVVLRFLRGTRGARLLTGLLLLLLGSHLVVQYVADRFELSRLQFLYEKFLLLLTVGSIVVFQPELRRALSRVGEAGFLGGRRKQFAEMVEELDEAVRNFAKNKIGAIIAVERNTGLGGIIETGVPLDAKVTAGLLQSVFWPGNALHDLGVVIAGGRIAAARCQFPLSEVGTPGGSKGSRHRAAIGLSEDSDALVIVVSEETGSVSFAERGRLDRLADPDDFAAELTRRLGSVDRARANGAVPAPAAAVPPPAPVLPPEAETEAPRPPKVAPTEGIVSAGPASLKDSEGDVSINVSGSTIRPVSGSRSPGRDHPDGSRVPGGKTGGKTVTLQRPPVKEEPSGDRHLALPPGEGFVGDEPSRSSEDDISAGELDRRLSLRRERTGAGVGSTVGAGVGSGVGAGSAQPAGSTASAPNQV